LGLTLFTKIINKAKTILLLLSMKLINRKRETIINREKSFSWLFYLIVNKSEDGKQNKTSPFQQWSLQILFKAIK